MLTMMEQKCFENNQRSLSITFFYDGGLELFLWKKTNQKFKKEDTLLENWSFISYLEHTCTYGIERKTHDNLYDLLLSMLQGRYRVLNTKVVRSRTRGRGEEGI